MDLEPYAGPDDFEEKVGLLASYTTTGDWPSYADQYREAVSSYPRHYGSSLMLSDPRVSEFHEALVKIGTATGKAISDAFSFLAALGVSYPEKVVTEVVAESEPPKIPIRHNNTGPYSAGFTRSGKKRR